MIVSRSVRVNDGKSDRYRFALDNVRVARQEPRVFRSSLLPAVEQVPSSPRFPRFASQIQKQLRSTHGIIGYSLRAKLLSRKLDSLCLGRRKNSDGFRRENSAGAS